MASARLLAALVAAALLSAACAAWPAAAARTGECTRLVKQYMEQHTADFQAPHDPEKLLFFLHVPRTAGKTYANCFLRTALPPSKRCAKSYDTLRLNVSTPGCQALVSHDDFSVSDTFPEGAATITQLRRPVERVLSAYQFAVDIAAKEVLHLDPAKKNPARRSDFVGTLEVWPWSYLIPWFKRDMAARLAAMRESARNDSTAWRDYQSPDNRTYYWNEAKNTSLWILPKAEPVLDPYNNSLVMPLAEWIEHPIAEELIHNGATLQVLGLTNYSFWQGHQALRGCLRSNAIAREMLLSLAGKRLKSMAHVGLTERLQESVLSMAADLGFKLNGSAYKYTSATAFSYDVGNYDESDLIIYNSTTQGGINVTLTRREAMLHLTNLTNELHALRLELEVLTPRLSELVDQEARWLEEQDALLAANSTAAGSCAAGDSTEAGSCSAGNSTALAAEGGGVEGAVSQAEAGADTASGARENSSEAAGEAAAEDGTAKAATAGSARSGADESYQEEDPYAVAVEEGKEKEKEEEAAPKIESPWSEEIEALDHEVANKQERSAALEEELAALHQSDLITLADFATGKARQLVPDDHYKQTNQTLAEAYTRCANAGRTSDKSKRRPYKHLRTPWGETFAFSREARKNISAATLARIHQLNALDEELWKIGEKLLEAKLEAQRAAGLLESFPAPPEAPAEKPKAPGTVRKLQSSKNKDKGKKGKKGEKAVAAAADEVEGDQSASGDSAAAAAASDTAVEASSTVSDVSDSGLDRAAADSASSSAAASASAAGLARDEL